jgi:glycosyltransferase involved in cell wall biosynthesis
MNSNMLELPPPSSSDKSGISGFNNWPWTQEILSYPENQPNGSPWPKISIITPSYNQASFLEETLRSVLLQGYPNLELIVLDGGSKDGSLEIIKKYSQCLSYWHSRKDSGQSDAINQGFRIATGEIVTWLNSDDAYLPGIFLKTIPLFLSSKVDFLYGKAYFIDKDSQIYADYPSQPFEVGWKRLRFWRGWPIPQPTVFFRRALIDHYGYLDESFHLSMDYELFVRFSQNVPFYFLDDYLATYRVHTNAKSGQWAQVKLKYFRENLKVNLRYATPFHPKNWPLWVSWLKYQAASTINQK